MDPDESDADRLRYAIVGGEDQHHQVFAMDEVSGTITLVNMHNFGRRRNNAKYYSLKVTVTDGVFSSWCKVNVHLVSANAFAPSFPDELIKVKVKENVAEGTLVARLRAIDEDRNDDDKLSYSIQSDEMRLLFRMDSRTGEVWSLQMLDREARDSYDVAVVATDAGGRSGFATLRIQVEDENDNAPAFLLPEYKVNIFANQTKGSRVTRVAAVDPDEDAEVTYALYHYNETSHSLISRLFRVDSESGDILLRESPAALQNQVCNYYFSTYQLLLKLPIT